ncbi:MAG TPA: glycosyltransferase family 39 protein [Thermomicrobiales bacterium]|jgi:4-amino-4-deoxy-L-arabinose transferase-like glycosyltransferase
MLATRPASLLYAREAAVPRRKVWSRRWLWEGSAVAAIVLVALLLRTYHLTTVPLGLHGDEATTGLESVRILREGNIGPYSLDALGQPTGPFYLIALAERLLGNTILAVRIVPALLGTLTVLALFCVVRRSYGTAAALAGAALLATQGWHLHFSRIGFPLVAWPLVAVLTVGALVEALRRNDWRWWGLAGLCLGLGVYSYNSHPLFIAITGLFVGLAVGAGWWRARGTRGALWRLVPVLALPIVLGLVALPLLRYAADPINDYTGHVRVVSVTNTAAWRELPGFPPRARFLADRYGAYWQQSCCEPRVDGADGSGTTPILPPPLLALAVAGAAIGCCQRRGRPLALFGVCVALLLPLSAAMTMDGAARRTFALAPFVALFAGLALTWPLTQVRAYLGAARGRTIFLPTLGLAAAAIVAVLAQGAIDGYFGHFARSSEARWTFAVEMVDASRYLATLPPESQTYFYPGRWPADHEIRRYFAPGVAIEERGLHPDLRDELAITEGADTVVFLFMGDHLAQIDAVRVRYPGGQTVIGGPEATPDFIAYRLDSTAIAAR